MLFLLSSTPSISSLLMFISHSSLSVRLSFFPSIYLPFLHSLLPSIFTLAFLSSFLHPSIHPHIFPFLPPSIIYTFSFSLSIRTSFLLFLPSYFVPLFFPKVWSTHQLSFSLLPFLPLASIISSFHLSLPLFINPSFIVYTIHIFPSIYPPIFLSLLLSSLPFLSIPLIHLSSICLFTFPLINPFSDLNFSCIIHPLFLTSFPPSVLRSILPSLLTSCFSFPFLLSSLAPSFNFHSFFLKVPSWLLLQLKPWTDREWLTRTIY